MYYFFFRKIVFSLLILAGIGVIILLIRTYWGNPEDQLVARFPVQSPTSQETVALAPPAVKPDLTPESVPKEKIESNTSQPVRNIDQPVSVTPQATTEPKPTVSSPTIEKKPAPFALVPEIKPSVPPPLTEAKKGPKKPTELIKKPESVPLILKENTTKTRTKWLNKKTVVVKPGDSIYKIAAKTYRVSNTSVVDRIMEMNPKIVNPDILTASQKVRLPEITDESLVITSSDDSCQVRLGSFLQPEYSSFLKGQPELKGKKIEITPWKTPSGQTWYRVTAGNFSSREEGLKVIQALKKKGLSPYFKGFKKKN